MLFNCFHCGKSISSKKDVCVYCKTDVSDFVFQYHHSREKFSVKERYPGTLLSFLVKTKAGR